MSDEERHKAFLSAMGIIEEMGPFVDMAAAMRRQFEAAGFTTEAAGMLVVEIIRNNGNRAAQ